MSLARDAVDAFAREIHSLVQRDAEWIGLAVPATGRPFQLALTTAVVRHADRSVYRMRWSLRDVSRRPAAD